MWAERVRSQSRRSRGPYIETSTLRYVQNRTTTNRNMGEDILHPRNKVTVMIIGNHSSGKSSFINWYCDEAVCRTGVAIESRGFTICTYGKRPSAPIKGEGTLRYFPHIKGLRNYDGVMDRFQTVTSVSNVRNFPLVDFMDTPGLVSLETIRRNKTYNSIKQTNTGRWKRESPEGCIFWCGLLI